MDDPSRLQRLHRSGQLTDAEYAAALAARGPSSQPAPAWEPGPAAPWPHDQPTTGWQPVRSQAQATACGSHDAASQTPWGPQGGHPDQLLPTYYQRSFARFDVEGRNVVWNWAAFLFGGFWYLVRGMWAKALNFPAVCVLSGGLLAVPAWIYAGLYGTHDYYLLRRTGQQM